MFVAAIAIASIGVLALGGFMVNKKNKKSKNKKTVKKVAKKAVQTIAKVPVAILKHENDMFNRVQSVININLYTTNQTQENNRSR